MELHVNPFRMGTDKEAALKVVEEAAEAFGAWEYGTPTWHESQVRLADELADTITACANLADRHGVDLQAAIDRAEQRNRERGRYD